jgi:hypothetical protein
MIAELVDSDGETIGTFQSPAVPRRDETILYDDTRYLIEDVTWVVETNHHQNVETLELLVEQADERY